MSSKIRKYSVTLLLFLLALAAFFTSTANAVTIFSSNDSFAIPDDNSQIRFAAGGSYDQATLKDNAWVFDGLNFEAAHNVTGFSVFAKDCNVTITGLSGIDWFDQIGWVTYNVTGVGSQIFGLSSLNGDGGFVNRYVVFIDGVNKTEGEGWTYTARSFTVTGAKVNVSIGYTFIYNPVTLEPESTSQPPIPIPTASGTPSSGDQPQEQVIYTITLAAVIVALIIIAFVSQRLLRPKVDQVKVRAEVHVKVESYKHLTASSGFLVVFRFLSVLWSYGKLIFLYLSRRENLMKRPLSLYQYIKKSSD
jgi:hypothetical protein